MKILIDVKENKATFILELLRCFSFVKIKPLTTSSAQILEELVEAIDNMKLVREGKLKPRPAKELLNEL